MMLQPKLKFSYSNIQKLLKSKDLYYFNFLTINQRLDKKIINGKIFIIILGIKILVKISGKKILTFKFLKIQFPQIKLSIIPKQ